MGIQYLKPAVTFLNVKSRYTEPYMADLAFKSLEHWKELERDAGDNSLRLMTGLLNYGDPNYGLGGPEGKQYQACWISEC